MAVNKKKPFSKYLSKIVPFSSEFLFTPQTAELVFILIIFLAFSYKNDLSTFSETSLGKTCLLILLFYSFFIHPKLGFILSILAIAYYYSDLVGSLYRDTTNTAGINPYLNENYTSKRLDKKQLRNDAQKASPFEGKFLGNLTSPDGNTVLKITTDVRGNLIQFNEKFQGDFIFKSKYGITYDSSNNISNLKNIDTSYCYIEGDILGYRQYNIQNNLQNYSKIIATIKGNVMYDFSSTAKDPTKYDKIWLHMDYKDCESVMVISDNDYKNIPSISAFTVREVEGFTFGDKSSKTPSVTFVSSSPLPPPNESFKDMETSVIVDAYPFTKNQVTIPSKFYTKYNNQLPATSNTSFSNYFNQTETETNKESFTDYQTSYHPINYKTISPQTKNDILLNNQTQHQNQKQENHFRKSYCVNNQLLYKNTPVRSEMAEHIFPNLQINGLAGSNGMKCNPCDPTCPISFSNLDQRLENENIIQKRTRTQQSKYNDPNWASKYYDVFLPNPNNHPEFNNQIAHSKSSYLIPANARITPMNTP
jgi:hypothetical protein